MDDQGNALRSPVGAVVGACRDLPFPPRRREIRSMEMKNHRFVSRRSFLRGAGVAVALPWMESLLPREAWAQAATVRRRYLPIFLPNGASDNWRPGTMGQGAAWSLSGPLSPLLPVKSRVTVISGLENGSSFNADGGSSV